MKISKIPGLGRFGIFVDDLDFSDITDDISTELGKLNIEHLVVIARDTKLNPENYQSVIGKFGNFRTAFTEYYQKKYNIKGIPELWEKISKGDAVDERDRTHLLAASRCRYDTGDGKNSSVMRVSGKLDDQGHPTGMFAEGELLWHSNESSNLCFTPGVSLLANSGVKGSATCFLTTVDYYESLSESFRSELDDMIITHKWDPNKLAPGLRNEQQAIMHNHFVPVENARTPMIITSPYGYKGLHFSINSIDKIEGMSDFESEKLLERIKKELFIEEYTYEHWYENDTDLLLFDNSITLHKRLGGITDRLCYRLQFDYNHVTSTPYIPYIQEEFRSEYLSRMKKITSYFN